MIMCYPALDFLERHRLRRARGGCIRLAWLVLQAVPTGEGILGQRTELVTLEFRVKQRATGLEIMGVSRGRHRSQGPRPDDRSCVPEGGPDSGTVVYGNRFVTETLGFASPPWHVLGLLEEFRK